MKKITYYLVSLTAIVHLISCVQSTQTNDSEQSNEADVASDTTNTQQADQLTYSDVVVMVYGNEGERIEWHGETMPNDLKDLVSITYGDGCGENECGRLVILENLADRPITFVIRGDYDIEGDQGYIPRKYVLAAGMKLEGGCSHLCYGNESYEFSRTVVASSYSEKE